MFDQQRGILPAIAASVLLISSTGCAPERIMFGDNIDLDFDWNPVANNQEMMHQPYVAGSTFRIGVYSRFADEDMTGWTVEVRDPEILWIGDVEVEERVEPGEPESLHIDAAALAAGETVLEVFDRYGKLVSATPVEVAVPDRAVLLPNGPLCVHDPSLIVDANDFQVLQDGLSTYLVEFYRGDERLYGNGTLDADSAADIEVDIRQSYLFEDRDWLQVTARSTGIREVTVYSGDVAVETVVFDALTADEVGHLVLHGEPELGAEELDSRTVLAQSYDFVGRPIYGVEYTWTLDGHDEAGYGDLYRYEYDPDDANTLAAYFGDLSDEIPIHGHGYVDSSNNIGCRIDNSGTSAGTTAAIGALLGLVALVRVRRAR